MGLKREIKLRGEEKSGSEKVQTDGSNALYLVLFLVLVLWASKGYWLGEL